MPINGRDFYMKHKEDNCHINYKKYFKTPILVTKFLKGLSKTSHAFQQTFRSILHQRPLASKNPLDWMIWKNKVLEHLEPVSNIPDDLCEIMIPFVSEKEESEPYSAFSTLPLPLIAPPSFEPSYTTKFISNDSANVNSIAIGFSVDVYLWKDIFSSITSPFEKQVANMIDTLVQNKELIPYLIKCNKEHTKTFLTNGATTQEDTYVHALAGGFAYRILANYLHQRYPTLPIFEEIVTKGQDYDVNFVMKTDKIESFPIYSIMDTLQSFCETINTLFHSTWNKIHLIRHEGTDYEVKFIKPSPVLERQGLVHSDYRYIHDRFLLTTTSYAQYADINSIITIGYQVIMCIEIKTPTETYCFTDHIVDVHFHKENEIYDPPYEMQKESWFPSLSIHKLLSLIANNKPIHTLPSTKIESIHRFQIGKHVYQLPNVMALLLQSMNAMVLRIALDNHHTYKARQDYARIYTILRMLQTIPDEFIITKKEISYIYTTLQSITMHKDWSRSSDSKKKEMIHAYAPSKIHRIKASFIDKTTQKLVNITEEYYKGPYEECRVNPKEEDSLLYELGVTKFNFRRKIIDEKIKEERATTKRKSCDGTVSVKRRIVKARKTRKTKK